MRISDQSTNIPKKKAHKKYESSTKSLGYWYCFEFDDESGVYYPSDSQKSKSPNQGEKR